MKLALDTNAYSRINRGQSQQFIELLSQAESVVLPYVVVAELRAGFIGGSKLEQNLEDLENFLGSPRTEVLYPTMRTTREYAQLFNQLKNQGTPIPTNDVWVAALALEHNCLLATSDQHFQEIPQLQLASGE